MALDAGAGQAFLKHAAVFRRVKTAALADGFVAPGVEHLHVIGAHERLVFHAALFLQLGNDGRIKAKHRRRGMISLCRTRREK